MSPGPGSLVIVEDDERFADTLALELRDRGYHVEWLSGLRAVEEKADLNYRFAVIDLRLRQDSGLDVVRIFKARSPETVIAVITGYSSPDTESQAIELGATAYLTKPVDVDRLERALLQFDG